MKNQRCFFPTWLLCLVALGLQLLAVPTASAASFINTGPLNAARSIHTATLLSNGKVLVAAGKYGMGESYSILSSAELYDPATGIWTATGALNAARYFHTATLLPNGKVLVAGGGSPALLSSAELYDSATGTWTATGALSTTRVYHTATLLLDGKVLVAGGYGSSSYLSSAELYDSATGTWTATGALNTARFHTATLLPNGKVLVAGGYNGSVLSSAELYDPATGTWTATGTLSIARMYHTATLLPNEKVLVAGGENVSGYLFSAELYEVDPAPGYNQITGQLLGGGDMRLSYLGIAGTNYALERTFDLSPVINWVPQLTNPAGAGGVLIFTNTPVSVTNNFWRIRSVP